VRQLSRRNGSDKTLPEAPVRAPWCLLALPCLSSGLGRRQRLSGERGVGVEDAVELRVKVVPRCAALAAFTLRLCRIRWAETCCRQPPIHSTVMPDWVEFGEVWPLGDSPPVLVTALTDQSSSFAASFTSGGAERRMYTDVDFRLLVGDMLAKFRRHGG